MSTQREESTKKEDESSKQLYATIYVNLFNKTIELNPFCKPVTDIFKQLVALQATTPTLCLYLGIAIKQII